MNIKKVPIHLVDVGTRIRALNPIYAAEIAASFEDQGQISPIEVREVGKDGRHALISGLHRLEAARRLAADGSAEWASIDASIVRCTNDEAELREVDENLVRHDLTALDRARFMARREQLWLQMHPDSAQGRSGAMARWHARENFSFARNAAEKLGITAKTVRSWIALEVATRGLEGELRARIGGSYLADRATALKAIAAINDDSLRTRVVELLLSGKGAPKKVDVALRRVQGLPDEHTRDEQDEFDDFIQRWARYSAETKRNIQQYVASWQPKRGGKASGGAP